MDFGPKALFQFAESVWTWKTALELKGTFPTLREGKPIHPAAWDLFVFPKLRDSYFSEFGWLIEKFADKHLFEYASAGNNNNVTFFGAIKKSGQDASCL